MTSAEYQKQYGQKSAPKRTTPASGTTTPPEPREGRTASGMSQEIMFSGSLPGNNGNGGLLRMHWRKRGKLLESLIIRVKCHGLRPMSGPVRLELVRYSIGRAMDYDGLVSTGKLPI